MNYQRIKIIIADDHAVFRDGLITILNGDSTLEFAGAAENGIDLVALAKRAKPDIILTDIRMPGLDGIDATKTIIKDQPAVGVIALSMFNEESLVVDMLNAGAMGYLLKSSEKSDILEAIHSVRKGINFYCKKTSQQLVGLIRERGLQLTTLIQVNPLFNDKELEIIRLICSDFTSRDIGEHFNQSFRTIEGYRQKIMQKMKVNGTAGIVLFAIRNGIFRVEK
ncbi:MAG: response regulator [Candidatus Pacearchaeota archaeon]